MQYWHYLIIWPSIYGRCVLLCACASGIVTLKHLLMLCSPAYQHTTVIKASFDLRLNLSGTLCHRQATLDIIKTLGHTDTTHLWQLLWSQLVCSVSCDSHNDWLPVSVGCTLCNCLVPSVLSIATMFGQPELRYDGCALRLYCNGCMRSWWHTAAPHGAVGV